MIGAQEYSKRIGKHILTLMYYTDSAMHVQPQPLASFLYCDRTLPCKHPLILRCLSNMDVDSSSITCLFQTWNIFTKEGTISEPELFFREFSILIFSIYKIFFTTADASDTSFSSVRRRISVVQVITLYDRITEIPIDDLLDVLDRCYEQFMDIMQEADISFDEKRSVIDWIQHFWWVPPVVIGALLYNIILAGIKHKTTAIAF